MEFGFTNDDKEYQRVIDYRAAVMKDGWATAPRYEHELISSYSEHKRDGFTLIICSRSPAGKWKYQAQVNIWGPDGLAIAPPETYDGEKIKAGLRTCNYCHEANVDTQRVGFAGRCCKKCLSSQRKISEFPGWTN